MSSTIITDPHEIDVPPTREHIDANEMHLSWGTTTQQADLSYFDNGLLEVRFKLDTRFTLAHAIEIYSAVSTFSGSKIRYLLFHISGLAEVDMCISAYFEEVTVGAPVAFVGSGPADQVLARFFMRKLQPMHLCRYVESRAEALEFLGSNV